MLVACSAFRTLTPVHVCMCDLFTLNLSSGFLMYSFLERKVAESRYFELFWLLVKVPLKNKVNLEIAVY